jgi:uncharacterized membrane protein YjfL (UPF0719 family)
MSKIPWIRYLKNLLYYPSGVKMVVNPDNVIVGVVFSLVGIVIGFVTLTLAAFFVPKLVGLMTPHIDEEKEILKGNVAVARYFGGVVQSIILGLSIIIAAAIVAGILD